MAEIQAIEEEPTPPKKKRGRGRPLGSKSSYPKGRKLAKRGAPPKLLDKAYQISVKIEESQAIMLVADFGSITEGIRALILAHLEQVTQPAPEAEAETEKQ